jgi:hypothetical protein
MGQSWCWPKGQSEKTALVRVYRVPLAWFWGYPYVSAGIPDGYVSVSTGS